MVFSNINKKVLKINNLQNSIEIFDKNFLVIF